MKGSGYQSLAPGAYQGGDQEIVGIDYLRLTIDYFSAWFSISPKPC